MEPGSSDLQKLLDKFNARDPSLCANAKKSVSPPALAIGVSGNIDSVTSPAFLEFANAAIFEAEELGGLILDIGGVKYISSTGVGSLIALFVETQKRKLPFFLCHIPDRVYSVINVLGVSAFFSYIESFEEAH
jgi:anti-sigma B factor antagonist